ncbi:metallophosphoesterase family protein [Legionella dresdenensis]|uniref:Metallophosphoesterase family protein n=1 Tax=Legionella dresdenensis TaxID=450200 RepID=A0ABV8CEW2_9GAMM
MKFFHISDLHFGMHKEEIIMPFLAEIAAFAPDIIIISGDLTHRATSAQYQQLQRFLNQISCPILTVPGNHDIPLHNPFARLLNPFDNYEYYLGNKTLSEFFSDAVNILGVNSVNPWQIKNGRLTRSTMDLIKRSFAEHENNVNLLFFHHNFDYLDGLHKPLTNDEQFLRFLKTSPVNIVCTGHLHYAHVNLVEKTDRQVCLVLHAGSLLCQRTKDGFNSYFAIELSGQQCKIDWRVFNKVCFVTQGCFEINLAEPDAVLESTLQAK